MLALHASLADRDFEVLGPNAGLGTVGQRVRYPDALVSRGFTAGTERMATDVVAVFEVLSPSASRVDRIVKLRDYGAVDSIRSYVILEMESAAIMAFEKQCDGRWIATALTVNDTLKRPVLDIELPVPELYAPTLV